ncbi:hypothetical protein BpHYR1_022104 [Brachionus plicatilis]|uniref:Uncharacterized protein n=1 Tax=Brachionus plicatilis TaxID=10195 RepID=A0A3M7PT39_BRAPC|nr:hypothetical protein BpHYR1_022104 [Brachionus plicatilis]
MNLTFSTINSYSAYMCWDPYKRTLNRPKFSETVTVSEVAGQLFVGRSFDRSARWSIFWTAKRNGLKYTGCQKTDFAHH